VTRWFLPCMYKCKISILAMAASTTKAYVRRTSISVKWTKPGPHEVKTNVDACFHKDDFPGATGAIL
jgi:hypothetical protein